ncbi:MAG TPA: HEAT repeat domain-containing protein [Vicinamibacteria bacterium]|nr:HEAT repeat domain-containing protein [Vicinamibacteria bacterium]
MAENSSGAFHRRVLWLLPALLAGVALASVAAEESFEDQVANLKSPTAKTRQAAAAALGKSRRREAVAPLSALVRDSDNRVRLEVVDALRLLRDTSAAPALVVSLQDGDPRVREQAISALVEIYSERERGGPIDRFLQGFSDEYDRASVPPYTPVDPAVFRGLAGTLRDEQKHIRSESAYAIGILDGRSVVKDLVAALQDPEPDVRAAAATALGKVGNADDGKALVPLLADQSTAVRNRAMQAIGVLRVRDAGPALREMFEQNRRRELGTRVLAALSRIGDPAQGDLFRELLSSSEPEWRRLAIEGMGRVADVSMLPSFKKDYQREKDGDVRLAYNFALVLLGDHAFLDSIVLALGSRMEAARARGYLLELGKGIAPEIYSYLNDPDAEVRGGVCDALAQLGDTAAVPKLTPLLNDPNGKVADRANRAIERLRRAAGPAAASP